MAPNLTRRILLGWEFGGGLGHVVSLREIAKQVGEAHPCEFLFALQTPQKGIAAGLPSHSVTAAPSFKRTSGGGKAQGRETYGEYVSENLMIEGGVCASLLAGWENRSRGL